jgi:hypothetical protein
VIDGLKLTMSGGELRALLAARVAEHRASADHWQGEAERTPEEQTDEHPLLPEHMCEYEADRHEWRAEVLEFIHDHVEPQETYRLAKPDLVFGELLPRKPGAVEQNEYEERTRVGFGLERIAKGLCRRPEIIQIMNPDFLAGQRTTAESNDQG